MQNPGMAIKKKNRFGSGQPPNPDDGLKMKRHSWRGKQGRGNTPALLKQMVSSDFKFADHVV